jgi:hypothetical protein
VTLAEYQAHMRRTYGERDAAREVAMSMTPATARVHSRPRPVRQPVLRRVRPPAPPPCFGKARCKDLRPEPEGYDGPACCKMTVCRRPATNFTTIWGSR